MRGAPRLATIALLAAAAGYAGWLLSMTLRAGDRVAAELQPISAAADRSGIPAALAINGIGNVAVFAPLGALLALAARGRAARRLLVAVGAAGALSGAIELLQASIPGRVSSLADWLLNLLGAAAGATLALLGARVLANRPVQASRRLSRRPGID